MPAVMVHYPTDDLGPKGSKSRAKARVFTSRESAKTPSKSKKSACQGKNHLIYIYGFICCRVPQASQKITYSRLFHKLPGFPGVGADVGG